MATVSKSFTATGAGGQYFVKVGDKLSYAISGTWVGTWIVERSVDGTNYEQVVTGTANVSATTLEVFSNERFGAAAGAFNYRFRCSAYTSGTMVTALADVAAIVRPQDQFKDQNGTVVMEMADGGVNFPGSVTYAVNPGTVGMVDTYSGFIETGADKTYVIEEYASFAYTINSFTTKLVSGTCSIALKIGSTSVTGVSAHSATSSQVASTASAANVVAVGDRITMVLSSSSTPVDLSFSLKYTRS